VREIRLYDSLSGQLLPVTEGDAIRVEVRTSPIRPGVGVGIEATRPLVLFNFLERFLQREGFGTKFLFDSPSSEDMLYELCEELEPVSADGVIEHDVEMSLHEVPRAEVEHWVNVCFGADREGLDWEPVSSSRRVLLRDALERFGHAAVAIYLLGTHYSLPLGDPILGLITASKNAERIRQVVCTLAHGEPSPPDMSHHLDAFRGALADDLDTPHAFLAMFEWVLEAERRGSDIGDNDLRTMLEMFELDDLAPPVLES
jgi:hypothetical protein